MTEAELQIIAAEMQREATLIGIEAIKRYAFAVEGQRDQLFVEVCRLRELVRALHKQCEPVGTGTGGDGDALNLIVEIYERTSLEATTARPLRSERILSDTEVS